jgi:D-hydroxyproline dehydrogenase subunit beta
MSGSPDVVILGAGIVGAACADSLARQGVRVLVLEADIVGGGATASGMGHLVVMDDSEAQFELTRYSLGLWNELAPELPQEAEFERRGTLWVAANPEEMEAVYSKATYYRERGVAAEILDAKQLRDEEPHLRKDLTGALLVHGDAVLYAPFVAQWLLDRAESRGATRRKGTAIGVDSSGVRLADGTSLPAGMVVCAAGTAAVRLFPEVPVRPRKGHLAITDRCPGFVRHQLVELGYLTSAHGHSTESVAFNIQPLSTGQVLIGSSRQYGVTHSAVDTPVLSRMLARAVEYMPNLANLPVIRSWTGFRAATEDKLPLLGPAPNRANVFLATGHEGLGITTSLGSAAIIRDLLLGRECAIPAAPYLPSRTAEPAHA